MSPTMTLLFETVGPALPDALHRDAVSLTTPAISAVYAAEGVRFNILEEVTTAGYGGALPQSLPRGGRIASVQTFVAGRMLTLTTRREGSRAPREPVMRMACKCREPAGNPIDRFGLSGGLL